MRFRESRSGSRVSLKKEYKTVSSRAAQLSLRAATRTHPAPAAAEDFVTHAHALSSLDGSSSLERVLEAVLQTLDEMGIPEASEDSVLAAPSFYDGPVLLPHPKAVSEFSGRIVVKLKFVGYAFEEIALLTVRQFCEMFVADSFPGVPVAPLSNGQYDITPGRLNAGLSGGRGDFPLCFVLGAPRSGTTLLRAMLNVHSRLWAPGELHLASYANMATRAADVGPILRYMPIPELAARCGTSVEAAASTFRGWERKATPVADVYQHLHSAAPDVMIVDKTPGYSVQLAVLNQINEHFPNAKFVHLVRSPHDMIRSYVRLQLHRGSQAQFKTGLNPYQMAEAVWFACNANSQEFLNGIPRQRQRTIRYEDLTAAPGEALATICDLLEREFEPEMADPYSAPGAVAQGAGDLHIHLKKTVEHRAPIEPFYDLGERCQELVEHYGY